MSMFDYGFGSAVADRILAEQNQTFLDAKANQIKASVRDLLLKFENAVRARNEVIAKIKALPEGAYKQAKIKEFKDVDEGGFFTPSFSTRTNALLAVLKEVGVTTNAPALQTLGFLPVAALASIPTATVLVIGGLATYFATQVVRYGAILVNPEGVAKADPSIFNTVGKGVQVGIILAMLGVGIYVARMKR